MTSLHLDYACKCGKHVLECDGYGDKNAKFMFIGLSAGKLGALITKVPFTKDGSGRLLQRTLGGLGLSESDEFSIKPKLNNVYITNLAKGRYVDAIGNNRLPSIEEIEDWSKYLQDEIAMVNPRTIITLGKLVFDSLQDNHKNLVYAKHPRWYFSHGGVKIGSKASMQMLNDYAELMGLSHVIEVGNSLG